MKQSTDFLIKVAWEGGHVSETLNPQAYIRQWEDTRNHNGNTSVLNRINRIVGLDHAMHKRVTSMEPFHHLPGDLDGIHIPGDYTHRVPATPNHTGIGSAIKHKYEDLARRAATYTGLEPDMSDLLGGSTDSKATTSALPKAGSFLARLLHAIKSIPKKGLIGGAAALGGAGIAAAALNGKGDKD